MPKTTSSAVQYPIQYPGQDHNKLGIFYGIGAFTIWGIMPLFYKELSHVPSFVLLAYRIVWSFIFIFIFLLVRYRLPILIRESRKILSNKKIMLILMLSAFLISSNWLVFMWAIANEHAIQVSLGYFINPLMNVALGILILGEALNRVKIAAIALLSVGILYMVVMGHEFPWTALYLATSFALYGLIRKKLVVNPMVSLWVEVLFMLPIAVAYLLFVQLSMPPEFSNFDGYTMFMLAMSGATTPIPLVLFISAAILLPLSVIGLLQYIGPSLNLMLAVFLWNEPFTLTHMIAFSCIWGAVAIYSADSYFLSRQRKITS